MTLLPLIDSYVKAVHECYGTSDSATQTFSSQREDREDLLGDAVPVFVYGLTEKDSIRASFESNIMWKGAPRMEVEDDIVKLELDLVSIHMPSVSKDLFDTLTTLSSDRKPIVVYGGTSTTEKICIESATGFTEWLRSKWESEGVDDLPLVIVRDIQTDDERVEWSSNGLFALVSGHNPKLVEEVWNEWLDKKGSGKG